MDIVFFIVNCILHLIFANRIVMLRFTCFLLLLCLSACSFLFETPSLPTDTPFPSATLVDTQTPTSTIVWFPPTSTFTPFPTQTIVPPTPEKRPGVGEIIFRDDFSDPELWALYRTDVGGAAFGKNELTIAIQNERAYIASTRNKPMLDNFYLEVTASPTLCHGLDEYGLLLHYASASDFYRFSLSCDGQVRLDRVLHGQASTPQAWMLGAMVPVGAPSFSRLGVWLVGKEIRCFVNDQYQFTVTDPTIPSGLVGVFARSVGEDALTVSFSDLVVKEVLP